MTISNEAFASAAKTLGVPEAAVRAVAEVESSGNGFLPDNRPKILFERHWMYKRLVSNGKTALANSSLVRSPDVVNKTPGGYKGGAAEHERLGKAATIDRTSALESSSWGAFQIMGYHWKALGYASIQEFVNAMYASDDKQLDAFVRFIKVNSNLLTALKKLDWATFAKGYNGSAYAENKYDTKMATAYKKYANK